ncbi:MAG: hypothetical protein MUF05_07395 [Candidatus Omnitrophica bacterium]|jgi:hypothetical protein|nr:hypothetical protein [Candidatus Omnitrophota bacterium]
MQNFIIVTKEGSTLPPNFERSSLTVENLQVLGFTRGNNKREAVRNFGLENKWIKEAGFSEAMAITIGENLKDIDFESFRLRR